MVQELRDLHVAIVFEKENINTLEITSDLFLTVAAAVAEEDLSRYRANVVWSIEESYRRGEPISFGGRLYGYNIGKHCKLTPNEKEAKVVNTIFELYLEGYSIHGIKKYLDSKGIKGANGGLWNYNTVRDMLVNEKYIGDVLLHKEFQINGQRYSNKDNKINQYYVTGHHQGIVSKELFDKVQEEIKRRSNKKLIGRKQNIYPFTGLIYCSSCGTRFHHKMNHSSNENSWPWYRCANNRDKCTSKAIREDTLEELFIEAFNEFVKQRYKGIEEQDYQNQIDAKIQEGEELTKLYANGWIQKDNYDVENLKIKTEVDELIRKQTQFRNRNIVDKDYKEITIFDPDKVEKFISKCVVKHDTIEFHFYNGVIITKKIFNRRIYHYVNK